MPARHPGHLSDGPHIDVRERHIIQRAVTHQRGMACPNIPSHDSVT